MLPHELINEQSVIFLGTKSDQPNKMLMMELSKISYLRLNQQAQINKNKRVSLKPRKSFMHYAILMPD